MRGQPLERVTAAARRHPVRQRDDLVAAEQSLDVEHLAERHDGPGLDPLGVAGRGDLAAARRGHAAVPHARRVLQAERRPPPAAAAAPHIAVMRGAAVDLRGDILGQPRGLGAGPVTVQRRVLPGLRVEVVALVALVRLDHVAAEPGAHRDALEHLAENAAAERHGVAPVAALERLEHPAGVVPRGRKVEGELRVGAREAALDEPVRRRPVALFVHVDERPPEERVGDLVPGQIDSAHPDGSVFGRRSVPAACACIRRQNRRASGRCQRC